MTYQTLPLSPALGAEVRGVDLTHIDDAHAQELNELWLKHHVLVIRDHSVTEDELVEFAQSFGSIENARKMSPLATRPEIMVISNIREGEAALGALPDGELFWHFDRIHQKVPNKAGVLHSIELPSKGGETRFSSMCQAYEALPEETKRKLEGLTALNTYQYGQTNAANKQLTKDSPSAVHPVVRTIPETGKKALYVCRLMTDRILELPEAESEALLAELFDHCERPEFIYEHSWRLGDTLIWDNRCVLHARNDFNENERRLLKRVTVGDTVAPIA
ncbi:TauD/TfdA dioxygenase family protein [Marinobacter algicola]|uniref:Taurine catabolism dioxygenase TauD/TfdA n=1 Tax=Marinobacter algicola DG893 TaxID=443152 RepID=A6F001_9GAMM|nr:TauD/TfdA family dioxygenase [Marinobacter algicola]EDM47914.1 Taurine catabolism dioxygenase TauD/TfdA [Marinobacter algicola DG893]